MLITMSFHSVLVFFLLCTADMIQSSLGSYQLVSEPVDSPELLASSAAVSTTVRELAELKRRLIELLCAVLDLRENADGVIFFSSATFLISAMAPTSATAGDAATLLPPILDTATAVDGDVTAPDSPIPDTTAGDSPISLSLVHNTADDVVTSLPPNNATGILLYHDSAWRIPAAAGLNILLAFSISQLFSLKTVSCTAFGLLYDDDLLAIYTLYCPQMIYEVLRFCIGYGEDIGMSTCGQRKCIRKLMKLKRMWLHWERCIIGKEIYGMFISNQFSHRMETCIAVHHRMQGPCHGSMDIVNVGLPIIGEPIPTCNIGDIGDLYDDGDVLTYAGQGGKDLFLMTQRVHQMIKDGNFILSGSELNFFHLSAKLNIDDEEDNSSVGDKITLSSAANTTRKFQVENLGLRTKFSVDYEWLIAVLVVTVSAMAERRLHWLLHRGSFKDYTTLWNVDKTVLELFGEMPQRGSEAMFADLCYFSVRSVQLTFEFLVLPCLLLVYLSQTAFLLENQSQSEQTFFFSISSGVFWPVLLTANVVAFIASRVMIAATFLLVFCLLFVITIESIMMVTTGLVIVVMLLIWQLNILTVLSFTFRFLGLELLFFSSVLGSAWDGSWALLLFSFIYLNSFFTSELQILAPNLWVFHFIPHWFRLLRYNGWVTELQDLERSMQLRKAVGLDNLFYTPDVDFSWKKVSGLFSEMEESGVLPNLEYFAYVFNACSHAVEKNRYMWKSVSISIRDISSIGVISLVNALAEVIWFVLPSDIFKNCTKSDFGASVCDFVDRMSLSFLSQFSKLLSNPRLLRSLVSSSTLFASIFFPFCKREFFEFV